MLFTLDDVLLSHQIFMHKEKNTTPIQNNYKWNLKILLLFSACLYVHNFISFSNVNHCTLTYIKNMLIGRLVTFGRIKHKLIV